MMSFARIAAAATLFAAVSRVDAADESGCKQYDEKSGKDCCMFDCSPEIFDCTGSLDPSAPPPKDGSCTPYSFDFSPLCKGNYEKVNKCEKQWDPRGKEQGGTDQTVAQKDAHWAKGEQMCNGDWLLTDKDAHTYAVSFCSHAYWKCLTATWNNAHMYGNVVQYWGGTPTKQDQKDACKQRYDHSPDDTRDHKLQHAFDDMDSPTGQSGCTADCQVLALGQPEWTLQRYKKGSTTEGRLLAHFKGAVPDRTDPFWCPFDPKTGQEEPRSVAFQFICDPSVPIVPKAGYVIENSPVMGNNGKQQIAIAQNDTDDCKYKVTVYTPEACSDPAAAINSQGVASRDFVLFIIIGSSIAVVLAVTHTKATQGVVGFGTLGSVMTDLGDTAKDGFAYALNGFQASGGGGGVSGGVSGGSSFPASVPSGGEPQYDTL